MHASLTAPSALTAPRMFAVPDDSSPASHAEGRAVDSSTLLRGQKAVAIVHNGAVYRLQATKLGKLILTK
ncbi:hemin uptake protein HemP [Diaphorobacter nitroreducens]|uniref:hemin uptake protein HemP n=1 Tax=Diaphorobacter nitroreducens TaxID=164759 RepID=UPI0024E27232|nr:hemin uptake protein HemP [Diaphorobacter nitroreducens]